MKSSKNQASIMAYMVGAMQTGFTKENRLVRTKESGKLYGTETRREKTKGESGKDRNKRADNIKMSIYRNESRSFAQCVVKVKSLPDGMEDSIEIYIRA